MNPQQWAQAYSEVAETARIGGFDVDLATRTFVRDGVAWYTKTGK